MTSVHQPLKLVILLPIYDDWECAEILLMQLDQCLESLSVEAHIIFLDDCSPRPIPPDLVAGKLQAIATVESLRLRLNLGHQRAISIGLAFVHQQRLCDAVLVMDADGEDKPEDVPRLIRNYIQLGQDRVVFAERIRRSEGLVFRLGYFAFRCLHRLLTGIAVRVGNFSVVPFHQLATLVVASDTWNHYAASVFKARLPRAGLPTERGRRLRGKSKSNVVGLVIHGLCAISVFAEVVGVRLVIGSLLLSSLIFALLLAVLAIRLGTNLAIPGWATSAVGLLLVILLQMFTVIIGLTLSILFNRNNLNFLPIRDSQYFISRVVKIYDQDG